MLNLFRYIHIDFGCDILVVGFTLCITVFRYQDEERLRDERKKARKNRDKYVGIGSDRMTTSKWDNNDYGGGNGGGGYDDDFG